MLALLSSFQWGGRLRLLNEQTGMSASARERIAGEVAREGFRIMVLRTGHHVTVHVRAAMAGDATDEPRPALPSLPRIVNWAEGRGMIHDRVSAPAPWSRLVSAFTNRPVQTPEIQIEALTEELLAEMRLRARNPKIEAIRAW